MCAIPRMLLQLLHDTLQLVASAVCKQAVRVTIHSPIGSMTWHSIHCRCGVCYKPYLDWPERSFGSHLESFGLSHHMRRVSQQYMAMYLLRSKVHSGIHVRALACTI